MIDQWGFGNNNCENVAHHYDQLESVVSVRNHFCGHQLWELEIFPVVFNLRYQKTCQYLVSQSFQVMQEPGKIGLMIPASELNFSVKSVLRMGMCSRAVEDENRHALRCHVVTSILIQRTTTTKLDRHIHQSFARRT